MIGSKKSIARKRLVEPKDRFTGHSHSAFPVLWGGLENTRGWQSLRLTGTEDDIGQDKHVSLVYEPILIHVSKNCQITRERSLAINVV